ncbi:MAG: 2-hydroxychromene-2-carboxylate isomerase [Cryomorphaceae bacterium]|jgi:2-hydroxychromene-2-carboxylate isomerase
MNNNIELIFDFVSPNAYLIWQPLKALAEEHGATIDVTPVFLGGMHKLTGNAPPMIRDAEVKGKNEYAMLEMTRFIKKHGLHKWQMNPGFPFNSIALQRMLIAVGPERRADLIDALLAGIWEQKMNVTDLAAMGKLLQDGGFNPQDLMVMTQKPEIKQELVDNTQRAVDRGGFGIPTIFVGDQMFFGKERLGQIADLLNTLD